MSKGDWIFIIIVVVVLVSILVLIGCHKPVELEIGERLTTDEARKEVVISITDMKERLKKAHATDILRFIFILAAVMGFVAWLRGATGGWETCVGGVAGLILTHFDQTLAYMIQKSWPYIVGLTFILAGFVTFLYRDRIGKAAFRKKLNGGVLTKAEQKLENLYVDKAKKEKMKNVSIS